MAVKGSRRAGPRPSSHPRWETPGTARVTAAEPCCRPNPHGCPTSPSAGAAFKSLTTATDDPNKPRARLQLLQCGSARADEDADAPGAQPVSRSRTRCAGVLRCLPIVHDHERCHGRRRRGCRCGLLPGSPRKAPHASLLAAEFDCSLDADEVYGHTPAHDPSRREARRMSGLLSQPNAPILLSKGVLSSTGATRRSRS